MASYTLGLKKYVERNQGLDDAGKYLYVNSSGFVEAKAADEKLNVNQGNDNAGKFMVVNPSGNVVPTTVPFANGVSF